MSARIRGLAAWFVVALVALLAWAPAPASAARAPQISYAAIATPSFASLCSGQTTEFSVSVSRTTAVNGQLYSAWVTGGKVIGAVADERIATIDPGDMPQVVASGPGNWATFIVTGQNPGRTTIEFDIFSTGEERRVGGGHPLRPATVTIEVSDCWEAYTSGLGTTFVQADMGDLTEPFFLTGVTPNVAGVDTESQFMFFLPSPQDRLHGSYAFIDTAWAALGPSGRCIAFISGRYDVAFYPSPDNPIEADLLLKGTGTYVCPGFALPIDYSNHTGFQIGMRPRAPGP
ncbi:MAG TPA: hypothetical protein VGI98_06105 [Candidatus Limnocylindrales bacterium]|jgi:hypothetical protein